MQVLVSCILPIAQHSTKDACIGLHAEALMIATELQCELQRHELMHRPVQSRTVDFISPSPEDLPPFLSAHSAHHKHKRQCPLHPWCCTLWDD